MGNKRPTPEEIVNKLRQAIALTDGRVGNLVDHPIALGFVLLTIAAVGRIIIQQRKSHKG